jgi:hypothetical protein
MKVKIIILITIISLSIYGCKKTHCPAFPVELAKTYFPYYEKMLLSFSYNNDTLIYAVNEIYSSKDEYYSRNCDCSCEANYYFNTDNRQLYGEINIGEDGSPVIFNIKINAIFYGKEYKDTDLFSTNDYTILGDTIFLKNSNEQTAIIIKNKGLTEFTTSKGEVWHLVE